MRSLFQYIRATLTIFVVLGIAKLMERWSPGRYPRKK